MNYIAHCLMAEGESPEFRFGSMAPDLVGMARCKLNRISSEDERDILGPTELEVQKGIDFHIATDKVFDEQPLFILLKRKFRDEIAPNYFPEDERLVRLFSDVGTELLLDGFVMENWSESRELFHETIRSVGRVAMSIATKNPKTFIEVADKRRGHLPDYSEPAVSVEFLAARVIDRPRLAIDPKKAANLIRAFEEHKEYVWQFGESLFLETRDAMADPIVQQPLTLPK